MKNKMRRKLGQMGFGWYRDKNEDSDENQMMTNKEKTEKYYCTVGTADSDLFPV